MFVMSDEQPSPAEIYAAVRDELIGALRSIDAADASAVVPACPMWTVKDVAAHLCGLNEQILADTPGPLGSDEATARQVGDRALATLDEVLDEWTSMSDAIEHRFTADSDRATALLADLVVHVYDLHEILGQQTTIAATATPLSAERYVSLLQERVAAITGTALTIDFSDGAVWRPNTDSSTQMSLQVSSHDFLRGVTGRLRRTDVEAFGWSADPSAILDSAWNQYGPFRS